MKYESEEVISTTALVRNLSSVIDRVRMTGHGLLITKGSQTIAKLAPPPKKGYSVKNLPDFIKSLPKLGNDGKIMKKDIKIIRGKVRLPENPWD